jgi:DNA topoisomerase-1
MKELSAYCVKCRKKRPIDRALPVFTSAGAPATRGVCPVCGAAVFRMGRTDAHDGLDPPASTKRAPAIASKPPWGTSETCFGQS